MNIEKGIIDPKEIQNKSFSIIDKKLKTYEFDRQYQFIIRRVVHTTADFDYVKTLHFSTNLLEEIKECFAKNPCIITDTNMVKAGIESKTKKMGIDVQCFMKNDDVIR